MSNEEVSQADSRPASKFEWRPEDVTILTGEEAATAEAQYQEWLATSERRFEAGGSGVSSDANGTTDERC